MSKIRWIIGLLVYKIVPIKKRRMVFQSYHGHYSDSPRRISEYILREHDDIDVIWILDAKHLGEYPKGMKYVIKGSIKEKLISGSAKILIDNVYCDKEYTVYKDVPVSAVLAKISSFFKSKKKQVAFTTFHGTPFKTQDRDTVNSTIIDFYCPGTEMILGNQFAVDTYRHITFNKIPMHLIGSPRNDMLFGKGAQAKALNCLGLDNTRKYLLYAPTFRNDGRDTAGKNVKRSGLDQLEEFDFDRLFASLENKFGGEWAIILRFHQYVSGLVDWNELNTKYANRFINGNLHDEMADYLAAADILMTDYSSSAFDYSLTRRLCLIYANDLDYFVTYERGLYMPLNTLPFPYATTFDDLIKIIDAFDEEKYLESIDSMHKQFGFVDDAHSTERVSNFILGRLEPQ